MAKWGSGEASAARGFLVQIDIFGMAGVCTIVEDGLSGLFRLLERTSAILPAGDRTSFSGLIGRGDNPKARKMGPQRVASMRRDGPVPAAERSCAAGDQQRLPCAKSEVGVMAPWGGRTKTEPD